MTLKSKSPWESAVFVPRTVPFMVACTWPFGVYPEHVICTTEPGGPLVGFNVTLRAAFAPGIIIDPATSRLKTNIAMGNAHRALFDLHEKNIFSTITLVFFDDFSLMVELRGDYRCS